MPRLHFPDHESLSQYEPLATPIWIFDVEEHGIWWGNRHALELWEADSLADLIARDFSTDSDVVRTRLRQIAENTVVTNRISETWTIYPKGKPKVVQISFQPVRIKESTHAFLIEVVHNIEPAVDHQAWRIMEAARSTALLISTFRLNGELLAQNPAATGIYGPMLMGVQNQISDRFVDPSVARHILARVAENERLSWEVDVQTNAGRRTHLIEAHRARDPVTGEFIAVLSEENVSELAALRKLQANVNEALKGTIAERTDRLRVVEESYALAIQTAQIWDWDLTNDRVFVSPGLVSKLGYSQAEFDKKLERDKIFALVFDEDRAKMRQAMAKHLHIRDFPLSLEARFNTKNGTLAWFQMEGQCLFDEDGKASRSVGVVTDITNRKTLEASLLVSQRMEAVGQLTGGIAHDFNNLLTVIQGNAELLEMEPSIDREITTEIVHAARRGADLTHQLLSFSRKQTLMPRNVDLTDLVTRMQNTILRALGGNISVLANLPKDLWQVFADETQIESALLNAALNARDAMPSGGTLTLACRNIDTRKFSGSDLPVTLKSGQYVEITVNDTGEGMSRDVMAKAFEPFFTTKDVGKGSGLGLSMLHGFCLQSGGDAAITSKPGKGARIFLYLPRSETAKEVAKSEGHLMPEQGKGEHIHILEDNPQVQKTLVRMVETLGYKVTTSSDAKSALKAASQSPVPDVFLTDIILPGGLSGVDFAEMLRMEQPDARIILMSGYPNFEQERMEAKGLDWPMLSKPLDKQSLADAFEKALSEH